MRVSSRLTSMKCWTSRAASIQAGSVGHHVRILGFLGGITDDFASSKHSVVRKSVV